MRRRLRLKHYSLRAEPAYLYWIRRYIQFNDRRHPRELDGKHVEHFLSELAPQHHVVLTPRTKPWPPLLFLYREVLAMDLHWMDNVVRAKRAPRLPVVLSPVEAAALLGTSGREALMAGLLYGSGLRLMERLRLRIQGVDLARHEITVREGKEPQDGIAGTPAVGPAGADRWGPGPPCPRSGGGLRGHGIAPCSRSLVPQR